MNQPRRYHRPAFLDPRLVDELPGGVDPALVAELAHQTAGALVARARAVGQADPELVDRLLRLVETEGIDAIAAMWSSAPGDSLPGALWRLYLLREWVRRDPVVIAERYRLGTTRAQVHEVVAGVAEPLGPDEMRQVTDVILSGVFTGDLGVALERAGAFCRVVAVGSALDADWVEQTSPAGAGALTLRAGSLVGTAEDLERAAARWRSGTLD